MGCKRIKWGEGFGIVPELVNSNREQSKRIFLCPVTKAQTPQQFTSSCAVCYMWNTAETDLHALKANKTHQNNNKKNIHFLYLYFIYIFFILAENVYCFQLFFFFQDKILLAKFRFQQFKSMVTPYIIPFFKLACNNTCENWVRLYSCQKMLWNTLTNGSRSSKKQLFFLLLLVIGE